MGDLMGSLEDELRKADPQFDLKKSLFEEIQGVLRKECYSKLSVDHKAQVLKGISNGLKLLDSFQSLLK